MLTDAAGKGDWKWFDIVRWTLFAMINAEELGISQANLASFANSTNPDVQRLLGDAGDVVVKLSDSQISFTVGDSLLASKLIEGNYPNFRQVIPGAAKERVTLEREAFLAAAQRVSFLAPDKSNSVKLHFSKDNIEITANSADIGEARESIAVKYSGPDMAIAFNPEYLVAPFRNLDADEIYLDLIDEVSPGVIKINTPFLYVLMPMRVSQ